MRSSLRVETAGRPHSPLVTYVAAAGLLTCALTVIPTAAEAFPLLQLRGNAQSEQSRRLGVRALPAPARYMSENGEAFVFDRSGARPLFQLENRNQILALHPTPAPRGDVIYRNDAGEQILRVTPQGNVTLYSVKAPSGSPASRVGSAETLPQPLMGPIGFFNLMAQRSALMSRALGRLVVINVTGEEDEALCVEALVLSTDVIIRLANSPSTRVQINELRTLTITEGRSASAVYVNGELRVTVQPNRGEAGRPSPTRIVQALFGR